MAQTIDKIALIIITFVISFCWISYITASALIGLICGIVIAILLLFIAKIVGNTIAKNKKMSVSEMMFLLALMGQTEATNLFARTIPAEKLKGALSPYILAEIDGVTQLVFVNFKYGKTIHDEIAKTYRKAQSMNINSVIVLSEKTDRNVMVMSAMLDIKFTFIGKSAIRKYLIMHNALPAPLPKKKRIKIKFNYKELLGNICDARKAKYYIFITIIMIILSFFTPLKLYYLILATIPFLLTIVSFVKSINE